MVNTQVPEGMAPLLVVPAMSLHSLPPRPVPVLCAAPGVRSYTAKGWMTPTHVVPLISNSLTQRARSHLTGEGWKTQRS
jgi:hypothetical protein